MKSIKLIFALAIFLSAASLTAQTVLRQSVAGNGGTVSATAGYRLNGTVGQALTGVAGDPAQKSRIGFWYQTRPAGGYVNQPPVVINTIAGQTLVLGGSPFSLDLNTVFRDPDGDVLFYAATSSDPSKVAANVSGNMLTITAAAIGNTKIMVTADDKGGGTVTTDFTVTVVPPPNRPPVVANAIPNQTLTVGSASFVRDLNGAPIVFSDPDGDVLSYSPSSSDPSKATAMISGSTLTVAPVAAGSATITVNANDGKGGMAQTTFAVTVNPSSPRYTLVAGPSTVAPGGQLRVDWTAPAGSSATDWIGLYLVGAGNTGYVWWQYTQGAPAGYFTPNAPVQPGQYEFRYFLNNGYTEAARSNPVTVTTAGYSLTATPSTVAPNGQLTVAWTAPAGSSAKDWIGLFKMGAANTGYVSWRYTNGATSGNLPFTAPAVPGQYEFRYFLNDGYTEVARSNAVTVNAPTSCWTEDFFDNLSSGSLAGQNGWYTVTGNSAANVVVNPGGAGKVLQLDPPAGAKVFMAKNIGAALSGTQSLELKVRVEQPGGASMAKLEVNTANNTLWDKKFQLYFGSSMRINNTPSTALGFVAQTVPQRWYQIKVVFDLGANIADLYLDGVLVLNDFAIGAGSISGIAVTGFDDPGYVLVDDIRGCTGGLLKASSGHAEETVEVMPSSFDLAQNYPNPFNPETTIQYAIPDNVSSPVRVTLRIYNLQGQVVRTLVDEQKSPGRYRVVWDGKNDLGTRIATGMYVYTITAGDFKATRRMTLMK